MEKLTNSEREELNLEDCDDVIGGARVVSNIKDGLLQTFCTQKCNCNKFEPINSGVSLNICDNCKWSQAPCEGSKITYCSVQSK